jgi:hypothetical protein
MFWFALASVAMSAAQAAKSANSANQASSEAFTDSLKQANAQNDAILQANTANTIRTGYRIGLQNLQKARAIQQASQQGADLSAKGLEALGQNQAVASASGTIGASVDAVTDDIKKKIAETQIDYDQTFADTMENAQIAIQQTVMAGQDSIRSSVKPNLTMPHQQNSLQAALIAGASTAMTQYASGKLSLGDAQPPAGAEPSYSNSLLGGVSGSYFGALSNRGNVTIQ